MSEIIRTLRLEEQEEFERFLERCYGHSRGFFLRAAPDWHYPGQEAVQCCLVLERDGKIVSHVATYPLQIVVGPAQVWCGGIGDVATLPEARGQGCMSRLMEESRRRMRERGMPLAALWGDQQRYQNFGYETCGVRYNVQVTRRGLEVAGDSPADVTEVDPRDPEVVSQVGMLHATLAYRVEWPRVALKLQRSGVRVFLGPDGYLITREEGYSRDLDVQEISSPTGREAELILGALNITFGASANVALGPGEGERTARLLRVASGWSAQPQGMLCIVDFPKLLQDLSPCLAQRAAGLPAFEISVGCHWKEEVDWATVKWDEAELIVEAGQNAEKAVVLGARELAAVLFGGPHPPPPGLGTFGRLLPVPLHIPPLDHV